MKTSFLIYVCCSLFGLVHSQNKIDSLKAALQASKNDIDKTQTYNALADAYKTSDPKQMLAYATKALALSEKIGYSIEAGQANLNLGNVHIILGNYSKALQYFATAQNIFEAESQGNPKTSLTIKKGLAKAYGSIGIVFAEQSNYAKALLYHLKSVRIYESIGEKKKCGQVYNNIGVAYQSQGETFKALEYFLKAQKIQEQLSDPQIGITLTNIANGYLKENDLVKALDYYTKAKTKIDANQDPRALGEWYNNMGLYHLAAKKPSQAIENWNAAITTFGQIEDKFGVANTYLYLGQLYLEQKNPTAAMESANQALQLGKQIGVLEQIVEAEKLLSAIYDQQHNSKQSLLHFKLYSKAKDSLTNAETIRKSVESAMNFEFEKREVIQREELQKKELLLQQQAKQNKLQLIFAALFALMLAGIAFLYYNRMQLKKTLTLQKELAEYEQKALHLQMNPHFVFNCLGSISSFIVQNGTHSAVKYLAKFSKLMRLTLEYSKQSLIPIDKEIQSLENYLELEQLRFNHKFNYTISKDKTIEDDIALPPLLLQPFVENAIIHGIIPSKEVGMISISFAIEDRQLVCVIKDTGIGYSASKAIKEKSVSVHQSMALDITKKRLQMISTSTAKKAEVNIEEMTTETDDSKGTKVTLHLPLQYIEHTEKHQSANN
ncbi:tetratricopeptide repeat protein [Flavobacterium sp. CYK-4]|uniref:tetratricopeptide repeat-containing sensor histidine kinase n=1 Tax=Flavobacterium lotistagni TaxID=2709660 RepID=UPI00140819C4|nr:tetratricopeptide repeat protein [Flavobacterium lotistagni]NHM06482.1 tetratricopeptide repeat protein [Flavobacterium lotistagni]